MSAVREDREQIIFELIRLGKRFPHLSLGQLLIQIVPESERKTMHLEDFRAVSDEEMLTWLQRAETNSPPG